VGEDLEAVAARPCRRLGSWTEPVYQRTPADPPAPEKKKKIPCGKVPFRHVSDPAMRTETPEAGCGPFEHRFPRTWLARQRPSTVADFHDRGFDGIAHAGIGLVTCMDSRIPPAGDAGLKPGDAKVLRSARRRVTEVT
jgi:hypothetical protein